MMKIFKDHLRMAPKTNMSSWIVVFWLLELEKGELLSRAAVKAT